MAKKKQTEDDVFVVLGQYKQVGRRPGKEKTVDERGGGVTFHSLSAKEQNRDYAC